VPHIASQSGFEIIDHPADMGFRVWARTLPELFELAGATLSGILADIDSIEAVNQTSV